MRAVLINGRTYFIDLWWQINGDDNLKQRIEKTRIASLLRESLRESATPYNYCVRREGQFGLGYHEEHVSGYSLAAAVANQINSLVSIGIYCLSGTQDDGVWWVLCCRTKMIASEGDRVFGTLAEAKLHAKEVQALSSSPIDIFETPEASFKNLLPLLATAEKIEPIHQSVSHVKLIAIICTICAMTAIGGWRVYSALQAEENQKQLNQKIQQTKSSLQQEESILQNAASYFPRPFEESTPDLLAVCTQRILNMPPNANGWVLGDISCSNQGVTCLWQYSKGASFENLPAQGQMLNTHEVRSSASHKLPTVARSGVLPSQDEATRYAYQLASDSGFALKLKWNKAQTTTVNDITVVAPFTRGEFELQKIPGGLFLDHLPIFASKFIKFGMVVKTIQYNDGWKISGEIYAQ